MLILLLQLSAELSDQLRGEGLEIVEQVLLPTDPNRVTADGLFVSNEDKQTCIDNFLLVLLWYFWSLELP